MKISKMVLVLTLLTGLVGQSAAVENGGTEPGEAMLQAAIFVQNRAGKAYDDKIDLLNDLIAARLTERGFSVIDKQYVTNKFRESRDSDAGKTIKALQGKEDIYSVEEAMNNASALRLAQMINADFILVATISSVGHTEKSFKGYGVENQVVDYTLRVSLRVLEAAGGGSVYGDVVQATKRIPRTDNLQISSSDTLNTLLDLGAEKIAGNIESKMTRIRSAKVDSMRYVSFRVSVAGVDVADVELDGAVIGSAGLEPVKFMAAPGIHLMRVTREWFEPWERTVSINQNQRFNIQLNMSNEGIARFKTLEGFKEEMARKRMRAEGEKKMIEESYIRVDTSNVEKLSVGGSNRSSDIDVVIEEEVK